MTVAMRTRTGLIAIFRRVLDTVGNRFGLCRNRIRRRKVRSALAHQRMGDSVGIIDDIADPALSAVRQFDAGPQDGKTDAEQVGTEVRYKAPKSGKARTVALSSMMATELKAHRARQAEEQLRIGLRPGDDAFVIAQVDSRPLKPVSLTHEWTRLLAKTDLPRIRFHDLRHTHASQMLAAGVHPKVASERLGHSTIGITLDLYSHVMPGMQADAAEQVDAALQAAISASRKTK
ncbi:tyrosine-type recombinase/integrase [Rhizobium rhizosphaerae]|uniref:tyrosine-type recombinase/integrase n=1 Tax=Xaviernesmea rhizosphaerae TaxID=1672749 RepID=UPI001FD9705E|nr:site-specific integrase [Xaviernesmea rhizosphaerae]